jgi:hypothetical protein
MKRPRLIDSTRTKVSVRTVQKLSLVNSKSAPTSLLFVSIFSIHPARMSAIRSMCCGFATLLGESICPPATWSESRRRPVTDSPQDQSFEPRMSARFTFAGREQ